MTSIRTDTLMDTNICWDRIRASCMCWREGLRDTDGSPLIHQYDPLDGAQLIAWGRCRSGRRWFWMAAGRERVAPNHIPHHGWCDTEEAAIAAAKSKVVELAGGEPAIACMWHGEATRALKRINAEKRAERLTTKPPSTDTSTDRVEYLHSLDWQEWDDWSLPGEWERRTYRVTRKTAKRVYYDRGDRQGEGFVDRATIERDGEVKLRTQHTMQRHRTLYAEPPPIPDGWSRPGRPDQRARLSELKKEMADAHPDRGGDRDTFMAARATYLRAKGVR